MTLEAGPESAATRRSSSSARVTAAPSRPDRHRSTSAIWSASTRWSTLRMFSISPSPVSGEGAVSVKRLTPTTGCSPDSMRRIRSTWLRTRRRLSSSIAAKAPPSASTSASSSHAASASSCRLGLDHVRALEDVVVLEQVGLEGEHLLHAQRPLLVPGPGQPERLVPRRQLHGPGPGALRQRHTEALEHDALHVVLRLLLGEAERVHLHPVAETAQLGIIDAVALAADAVPELGEGTHLAGLLHEANAGVDEEADAAHHRRQLSPGRSCPNGARRRARRWPWRARTPPPGPASPRPLGGGSCTR